MPCWGAKPPLPQLTHSHKAALTHSPRWSLTTWLPSTGLLPPVNITTLGTTLPAYEPFGDRSYLNHSRRFLVMPGGQISKLYWCSVTETPPVIHSRVLTNQDLILVISQEWWMVSLGYCISATGIGTLHLCIWYSLKLSWFLNQSHITSIPIVIRDCLLETLPVQVTIPIVISNSL